MRRNDICLALSVCLLLFAPGPAIGGGIVVESDLTSEFTLKPGDATEGQIVVRNNSDTPQQVSVSQVDYSFQADGSTLYADPGSLARSNCEWITVAPKRLSVPANSKAVVYFTIQVPRDETLRGTYWSVLMVEPIAQDSLEPPRPEQGKIAIGLRTIMRYAVQVVTSIGSTGSREIKIPRKQLLADNTGYTLQLDIENTGERWLRPYLRVELYDAQGSLAGRVDGERMRVYPGCSVRNHAKLGTVKPGKYTALVLLDNRDESVWAAQYELDIK